MFGFFCIFLQGNSDRVSRKAARGDMALGMNVYHFPLCYSNNWMNGLEKKTPFHSINHVPPSISPLPERDEEQRRKRVPLCS